jgi:hypothetical protein
VGPPAPAPAPPRIRPSGLLLVELTSAADSVPEFWEVARTATGWIWLGRREPRIPPGGRPPTRTIRYALPGPGGVARAQDLATLSAAASLAIAEDPKSPVLVEDLEYLVLRHGTNATARFLSSIAQTALGARARVWAPIHRGLIGPADVERLRSALPP